MPIRLTQNDALGGMILRMSGYPRALLQFKHPFRDETVCARHLELSGSPLGI